MTSIFFSDDTKGLIHQKFYEWLHDSLRFDNMNIQGWKCPSLQESVFVSLCSSGRAPQREEAWASDACKRSDFSLVLSLIQHFICFYRTFVDSFNDLFLAKLWEWSVLMGPCVVLTPVTEAKPKAVEKKKGTQQECVSVVALNMAADDTLNMLNTLSHRRL